MESGGFKIFQENQKGKISNFLENDPRKFLKNISGTSESVISNYEVSCVIRGAKKNVNGDTKFCRN